VGSIAICEFWVLRDAAMPRAQRIANLVQAALYLLSAFAWEIFIQQGSALLVRALHDFSCATMELRPLQGAIGFAPSGAACTQAAWSHMHQPAAPRDVSASSSSSARSSVRDALRRRVQVGKPRPSYLSHCQAPDPLFGTRPDASFGEVTRVWPSDCTGPRDEVDTARMSFPSGHAAAGSCVVLFGTFYLFWTLVARRPQPPVLSGAKRLLQDVHLGLLNLWFMLNFIYVRAALPRYAHLDAAAAELSRKRASALLRARGACCLVSSTSAAHSGRAGLL
jgi:PAP2 superfamily